MIYIENKAMENKIYDFIFHFNKKQKELETHDTLIYPAIPTVVAIKYNILYPDLMFHDLVLRNKKFYEDYSLIENKKEIVKLIESVLEFELSKNPNECLIDEKVLNKIIKAHKKLKGSK